MIWNIFGKMRRKPKTVRAPPEGGTDEDYKYTPEVKLAADGGDPVAQTRLATAYHEGLGIGRNPELAFKYSMAAARQGHPGSQAMVGVSYDIGVVVDRDR